MSLEVLKKDLQEAVISAGVQIVTVSWEQFAGDKVLQVAINHPDGVDVDLCVAVTNMIETIIDSYMVEEENFFLEVTSLGAEQPFNTFAELHGAIGTWIHVELKEPVNGLNLLDGTLLAATDDEQIEIEYKDRTRNKQLITSYENVQFIRRAVKF